MQEYLTESKSLSKAAKKPTTTYTKGKNRKFDWEMQMVCRKHQEWFMFQNLALKKGYKGNLNCNASKRGHKRSRNDRIIRQKLEITTVDSIPLQAQP